MSKLIVRHLKKSDKEAFKKAILETKDSDPNFAHYFHPDLSYADYVEDLLNKEKGMFAAHVFMDLLIIRLLGVFPLDMN